MHRMQRSIAVAATLGALAGATGSPATTNLEGRDAMSQTAKGSFDVKVAPVATQEHPGGTTLGRFTLDKTFHGDLEGTSKGEMLTAGTAIPGSAGYVAIERVEGTLAGRKGSFVLQHSGSMAHGGQSLAITVVPDSGTGDLLGLAGTLTIEIENKAHFYRFEFSLP